MGANTAIEWADHTHNPWVGCQKVSPACDHCYAEGWAKRTGQAALWQGERRRTSASNWRQPVKWNREAEAAGKRARVFCASLADVFDNQVPVEWRVDLWQMIYETPHLDWLLLTKRPQNIAKMLPPDWCAGGYANVWLGTTVENQEEADRRIPHLLAVPARVHFLSCEPLLGPVNIDAWTDMTVRGRYHASPIIGWVIAGGESGPGARPMHPDWARSLRNQCADAGVPFFFKQWGEWTPGENVDRRSGTVETADWFDGRWLLSRENLANVEGHRDDEPDLYRVGKKAAGALLDGREHREFPDPAPHAASVSPAPPNGTLDRGGEAGRRDPEPARARAGEDA